MPRHWSQNKRRALRNIFVLLVLIAGQLLPMVSIQTTHAKPKGPRVFLIDGHALAVNRARLQDGDERLDMALDRLVAEAEQALKQGPWTVTSKPMIPPSGDKHDYMSLARYWWPNPKTPTGLPYIRRDGYANPEIFSITDKSYMERTAASAATLGMAYYFTGDERYAAHAARLLRVWFLDADTRMNPNLNFGQAIRGINDGRAEGIIETRIFPDVVDAIGLLEGSPAWTAADQQGMRQWFGQFLDWLRNSPLGREEAVTKNNHATWYDTQVISLAFFIGDESLATSLLNASRERIRRQILPDGRQPEELARTDSWHYSNFNLEPWFRLAALGEHAGVDIWQYETEDGRSIRKALDFLLPYALGERPWPYPIIQAFAPTRLYPGLRQAAIAYHENEYRNASTLVAPDNAASLRLNLTLQQPNP